jgi:hypothetical protein
MQLNSYMKTAMSHDDLNRCTPYREKSDLHNTYSSRASLGMPHVCFLRAVHKCGNLSLAINSVGWTLLLLRKRAPDTISSTLTDQSVVPPPSFSPKTTIEVVMKAKHLLTTSYNGLLGP